jgi:Reverse transcriptase (RNA-dependent DNA polymerase)
LDNSDQFAFKPTGSATCALVYLLHKVSTLLESNNYVRCIMIDFKKAFDVIDRSLLLDKLSNCSMPSAIKSWIAAFLSNRSQATRVGSSVSPYLPTNLGIIQGSVLGPSLFTIMISDLKTISPMNDLCKFADDLTLIAPENSDLSLADEFESVKLWAKKNKLFINFDKTKEMVFHRQRPSKLIYPPPLNGIERLVVAKLLGVYINETLSFSPQVDHILSVCSQRMFLLRRLRARGLPPPQSHMVFTALVLSKILYAVSAWGGFLSLNDQKRIDAIVSKCVKYGFCKAVKSFQDLLLQSDRTLFKKLTAPSHCLHHLLPAIRPTLGMLRHRGHPYILPNCRTELYKRSFLVRSLFNFV